MIAPRLSQLGFQATSSSAGALVTPDSAQAAADLLGTCSREGWRVRFAGGGSRFGRARPADVLLSTARIAGIDIHVPEDLTIGVLAGTTHEALDAALTAHRQVLPLDPPVTTASTIGASVSAGAAGPLRAGYGTPRDLVLGLHAVTGDGRMLRLGGQVVKNVAGYDLVRLLIGSRGTLALITQAHFRVRATPAADATFMLNVRDAGEAAARALELRDRVHPVALEVLGPRGAAAWRVAFRLQGGRAAVDAAARGVPGAEPIPDPAAFWAALSRSEATAGTRIRFAGPPASLEHLLQAAAGSLKSRSDNTSGEWRLVAHGADGIVRLTHPGAQPGDAARLAATLPALAADLATYHGTCICEIGPESMREAAPPPAPPAVLARLEAELRRRFDPAAILVGD